MKISKKIILFVFLFLTIIFIKTNVNATNISISPANPKVGDTVTVTVEVPNVHTVDVTANVSGVVSGTIKVVGGDLAGNAKTYSESAKYKCEKEGEINVTISSNSTAVLSGEYVDVKASKTVKVTKETEEKPVDNTPKLSSDATLKMLGITPNDFKGFKSGTTSYSVTVPKETDKINVYAEKNQKGQTITGTGDKTLKIGENKFEVKVTAEDKKTTKTYTIVVTRESTSSNATLTNLGIRPNDFRGFKSGTLSYNVNVPYDTEKVEVYAEKRDGQTVTGIGEKTLKVGKNTFEVKVTAEDKKTTKTYTIVVNRQEEGTTVNEEQEEEEPKEETPSNSNGKGLTKLEIAGITLKPEFNNEVYEYSVDVTDENKKLNIKTETSGDKIKVDIVGNEELKVGENVITLLVYNSEDDTTTTYQIIANVKQAPVDNSIVNSTMNKAQKGLQVQRIIVYVVAAIILILIITFFIKRKKILNEEESDENEDYSDEFQTKKEERKTEENEIEEIESQESKRPHGKGRRYK